MPVFANCPDRRGWLLPALPAAVLAACQPVVAQNALVDLPTAPSGFSSASAIYGAPRQTNTGGFMLLGSFATTYDSNVNQAAGSAAEDDFIISPGLAASYISEGREWVVGANLAASYDEYLEASSFSGFNRNASAFAGYRGGPFSATLRAGFATERGVNRYYGGFVEQERQSLDLILRYRLSPKTSLAGTAAWNAANARSGGFNDTEAFSLGLSGLWKFSRLTEIGPGIRYTLQTGENQQDRATIGPTLSLNYQLSSKVSLRSRVGVDFVDYSASGSADPLFAASAGLTYRGSDLWAANFTFFRDAQADPRVANAYNEVTYFRLGYVRKVRRVVLNLGLGYETRTSDTSGTGIATGVDQDYLTLDSSLSFPVIDQDTDLTLSLRYRDLSGGGGRSWDGIQTGLGVTRKF